MDLEHDGIIEIDHFAILCFAAHYINAINTATHRRILLWAPGTRDPYFTSIQTCFVLENGP